MLLKAIIIYICSADVAMKKGFHVVIILVLQCYTAIGYLCI